MTGTLTTKRIESGHYWVLLDGEYLGCVRKGAISLAGTRIHNDWHFTLWHEESQCARPKNVWTCILPSSVHGWIDTRPDIYDARFATKADTLRALKAFFAVEHYDEIVEFRQHYRNGRRAS